MKVLTPEKDFSSFQKIFKEMQKKNQKIVFWQVSHGHRTICETHLISYNPEDRKLFFKRPDQDFLLALPIYFYDEAQELIFKSSGEIVTPDHIEVKFPAELRLLDAEADAALIKGYKIQTFWSSKSKGTPDLSDEIIRVKSMKERSTRDQEFLGQEFDDVSLDEEDKLYADKRESPRVRPKAEKLVKLKNAGDSRIHLLKLFDLSRGGMGFLTYNPDKFPKGGQIYVTGFDAFDLDDPLLGTIVASRPVDGANVEFKIGVKFTEGQE